MASLSRLLGPPGFLAGRPADAGLLDCVDVLFDGRTVMDGVSSTNCGFDTVDAAFGAKSSRRSTSQAICARSCVT